MRDGVMTVGEETPVSELVDRLQEAHVHSAPVVDEQGNLVGVVSQEDVILGSLGLPPGGEVVPDAVQDPVSSARIVRHIMTAPAISTTLETSLIDVARMMWQFRIHHLPVVQAGRVVGMVSSLDFPRLFTEGRIVERRKAQATAARPGAEREAERDASD